MKNRKSIFVLNAILFSAFYFLSCDKSEGEGSGSTDPGSDNAEIIEGFICSDVFDNKPRGIDNDFLQDDVVYLWLSWQNVSGKHEVKIIWVDPEDDIVETSVKSFNSTSGKQITFFFLDTSSSAPTGRWYADIYIDDEFVRSYAFWINE